jgi:ABC-type uncharacterized transport system substrate-binding protein
MGVKRLEVLREIIPEAVLWTQSCRCCRAAARDRAAHALGIAIVRIEVNAPEDMEKAFQAIVQEHDNAVAVLTAPQLVPMSEQIAFGLKHRIAGHCRVDGFVQLGGLVTLRPQRVRRREAAARILPMCRSEGWPSSS